MICIGFGTDTSFIHFYITSLILRVMLQKNPLSPWRCWGWESFYRPVMGGPFSSLPRRMLSSRSAILLHKSSMASTVRGVQRRAMSPNCWNVLDAQKMSVLENYCSISLEHCYMRSQVFVIMGYVSAMIIHENEYPDFERKSWGLDALLERVFR